MLFLIALPFVSSDEGLGTQWLVALIAWLMPFLPTPGNIALAGLTRVAAGPDVPRLLQFRESLRKYWRLSLKATLVSLVVEAALVWNVTFYLTQSSGWVQFVSILWLYAVILWLSLHIYLLPLAVHVPVVMVASPTVATTEVVAIGSDKVYCGNWFRIDCE